MKHNHRPARIVALDVESSGLHVERGHRPWEIAWSTYVPGDGWTPVRAAARPLTYVEAAVADAEALNICRYDDRAPSACVYGLDTARTPLPYADWLDTIARALDGATIAGSNPAFDMAMLIALYADVRRPPPRWAYRPLDAVDIAAGIDTAVTWPWTSRDVRDRYDVAEDRYAVWDDGVRVVTDHTAATDVRWVCDLLDEAGITDRVQTEPTIGDTDA